MCTRMLARAYVCVNKTGPKTKPWWIPNSSDTGLESCPRAETSCFLSVMSDLSYFRVVVYTPKHDFTRATGI